MTTDALRAAIRLEREGTEKIVRDAEKLERKAEAKLQTTLQTAAFILGALLGFLVGFAWGMWKAFDILSKVVS